jgi:DNA mismatch repair ATPase MutL
MANKKVESIDEVRPNVFEAIKRAFIRRGRVPRPKTAAEAAQTSKHDNGAHASDKQPKKQSRPPTSEKDTQETESADNAEVTQSSDSSKEEPTTAEKADKEAESGPEELIELTERVHDVLYEATTVFPFTLFPDTITLDREKLTIAERFFWRTADITSVPISEILSCTVNVGPFFGSIHLVFSFFADNERRINFLWRHEAMELQRMVHGFIIAHKREINTTIVSTEDLRVMLKDIGHGAAE